MITGKSTHNQKIERLWRDMHRSTTLLFYHLFYFLEHHDLLQPNNEQHLFALHYVYKARINQSLNQFKNAWNNHSIRTEHSKSPNQLFTAGALQLQMSGLSAVDFFNSVDEFFGVEEDGLTVDDNSVAIPNILFHLTEEHQHDLEETVNPLAESSNYAIELYQQTVAFVSTCVAQHS